MNEKEGILAPSVEKKNPQKVVFFIIKRRVVLSKTTACFTKNDGLFYQKRRLVLPKTTGCFTKNDGLFYQKRQVVSIRRKASAEAFAVISSRAHHPILLFHKPSQGKNCAKTTNLRRNKSHNTK